MTRAAVVCALLLLLLVWRAVVAENPVVSIQVHPRVAHAPASFILNVRITRDVSNRWLEIVCDGGEYYRESDIQLDGDAGPSAWRFENLLRDVPMGQYVCEASVYNLNAPTTRAQTTFSVVGLFP